MRVTVASRDVQAAHDDGAGHGDGLLVDDGAHLVLSDVHLAVGELLELLERPRKGVVFERDLHLGERISEAGPPGMLAEDDLSRLLADGRRVHDLVGGAVPQHPVLMDS
jgi:hypothetical protein